MKRSSNVTAWQLRLFEGFDRDVMVMQRDEEEVFDDAIHVFFEKEYYDSYVAKATKYSTHRYAYHEDKLGEVVNQIFDENIPGLVLHMETQEKGLCEERYLDQKSLYMVKSAADSYHHLFTASISRMPKEQAVARLWVKSVFVIGTLPDPSKPDEPQKVEIMTMRRKADGTPGTAEDFDHESVKVFLTADSAMRFNPDKKPISKTKLCILAMNLKGRVQIVIEPHREYALEFDPATLDISKYTDIPQWNEDLVKQRIREFSQLDECYCILTPQVTDYKLGISAPFLIKVSENNFIINVFEKYEDALDYCIDNPGILPIRDNVYPVAKIEKSDKSRNLNTLICLASAIGVQNITLDAETAKALNVKVPYFMDVTGFEKELSAMFSPEECEKMKNRLPLYNVYDFENSYEVTPARKNEIKEHLVNDKDKAQAFLSGCSVTELIFALSEIGRMYEPIKDTADDKAKFDHNAWLNLVTVLLTEEMLEKPFVFTLRNDDSTFTQKNGFAYILVTDRFENIRTSEGKLTLAGIDNENFMQKFVDTSKIAIVTDGPNALALADARVIQEVAKHHKKEEASKEEVIIILTQGFDMSYTDANAAYKKLKTDSAIYVEFLSTVRNNEFPPLGMVNINGYTAQKLAKEKNLNVVEAYCMLLDLKAASGAEAKTQNVKVTAPVSEKKEEAETEVEEKKSIFGKLFKK